MAALLEITLLRVEILLLEIPQHIAQVLQTPTTMTTKVDRYQELVTALGVLQMEIQKSLLYEEENKIFTQLK